LIDFIFTFHECILAHDWKITRNISILYKNLENLKNSIFLLMISIRHPNLAEQYLK